MQLILSLEFKNSAATTTELIKFPPFISADCTLSKLEESYSRQGLGLGILKEILGVTKVSISLEPKPYLKTRRINATDYINHLSVAPRANPQIEFEICQKSCEFEENHARLYDIHV